MQSARNEKPRLRAKANMDILISTGELSASAAEFNLVEIAKEMHAVLLDNTEENTEYKTVGVKSCYSDELLPGIEKMAAHGCNNRQIAAALNIGYRTFYDWMNRYPQISLCLKKFRGIALIQVENAMFKSAMGYQYTEVKKERKKTGKDNEGNPTFEMIITEATLREVSPNLGAQVYITKNLMSHKYKDKVETVHSLDNAIESMAFAIKRREE